MATYTPTVTPRLRMTRHSPVLPDRSTSQIASASESGPSHLPDFSQLVDVNLNGMVACETTEQQSVSRPSTPSTVTRSENPAATLRALLNRLPAQSTTPSRGHSPSQQYASERESDYDISEPTHSTPSIAQESLKDIFSKARRDPGDTPRKSRPRRSSVDEVEESLKIDEERTDTKGKQRSLSDDEVDQTNHLSNRNRFGNRSRATPQPVTMEFLHERFSNSQSSPVRPESPYSNHDDSNETATILLNLSTSPPSPPAATSTPQQSLRMSVNSQFHSNLLDENTEMQHAIDGLESYGENSVERSMSPPPIMRKRKQSITEKTVHISSPSVQQSTRSFDLHPEIHRSSSQSSMRSTHANSKDETDELAELNRKREHDWNKPNAQYRIPDHSHSHLHNDSHLSPIPNPSHSQRHSVGHSRSSSPSGSSAMSLDDGPADILHERERNWNAPQPAWHKSSRPLSPSVSSPQPLENGRQKSNSFQDAHQLRDGSRNLHRTGPASSIKSPNISRLKERRDSQRSLSPLPPEPSSPTPSRTSSLQAIDNTYRHDDPSLRRPARPSSPLASLKKRPASPNTSTASRKLKTPVMISSSRKQAEFPSLNEERDASSKHLPWPARKPAQGSGLKFPSTSQTEPSFQSIPSSSMDLTAAVEQVPMQINDYEHDTETDDMRETDFSSQGEHTSKFRPISPAELSDEEREHNSRSSPPNQDSPRLSNPPSLPLILVQDGTPRNTFPEVSSSPSTPPRRSTPRSLRKEFKTPSPPKGLPDLPSPSSSEKSEHNQMWTPAATPQPHTNGRQGFNGMLTPRPPGGWAVTPQPSREADRELHGNPTRSADDPRDDDGNAQLYPRTPTNRVENLVAVGKTPKPPGGWVSTPAPPSSRSHEQDILEQSGGLLTPVASLSKGTAFDMKTPGLPGGWLATPAPKKSILKVRFNSETTSREDGQAKAERTLNASLETDSPSQSVNAFSSRLEDPELPPSPRSPRKSKTSSIRVLDAFGREQGSIELESENRSRNLLRVVDSMGHEVPENQPFPTEGINLEEQSHSKSSRGEILAHIRQGLDDLAGEFDNAESNDGDPLVQARIEELNRVSKQARKNRERLQHQNLKSPGTGLLSRHKSVFSSSINTRSSRNNPRLYAMMVLVQLILLLLMYRVAMNHARKFLLNNYYDPFNPEVHLYVFNSDPSFHFQDLDFSPASWCYLIKRFFGVKTWYNWLHFAGDIPSYFWNIWKADAIPQKRAWLPT